MIRPAHRIIGGGLFVGLARMFERLADPRAAGPGWPAVVSYRRGDLLGGRGHSSTTSSASTTAADRPASSAAGISLPGLIRLHPAVD